MFTVINLPCLGLWVMLGTQLERVLSQPRHGAFISSIDGARTIDLRRTHTIAQRDKQFNQDQGLRDPGEIRIVVIKTRLRNHRVEII